MSARIAYSYVVLRYMHDITTGEFVNVGVALYAPARNFLGVRCRSTYGRLSRLFPNLRADHFKSLMKNIESAFRNHASRLQNELPLVAGESVLDFAHAVLPPDDSSLQWGPVSSGLSADPEIALEKIFQRMVMRHEDRSGRDRRGEEDVWRSFKTTLERRNIIDYLEPHTIAVKDDEVEFKHTWKNGVLHCFEPVSFDLASADSIKEKVHRWLGRIYSIHQSNEKFEIYFLVGEPADEKLKSHYEKAIKALARAPVKSQIFSESEAEKFAEQLAREIRSHEAEVGAGHASRVN